MAPAEQRTYTVLVSIDGGGEWKLYTRTAKSVETAIESVRKANLGYRERDHDHARDPEKQVAPLYFASATFEPKRMTLELIEKWSLSSAGPVEEPAQVSLDEGE